MKRGLHPMSVFAFVLAPVLAAILAAGCSTPPRRPLEVRNLRNSAAAQLEMLNREADRGNYAAALEIMRQTRSLAVASDDPALLIKTGHSLGNILFFLGRVEESDRALEETRLLAEETGDRELAAISAVYIERQKLLKVLGRDDGAIAAQVRDRVRREAAAIKNDSLAAALAWTVVGLAEKELGRHAEAEAAFRRALDIHVRERYLEQAAYDWYLVASVRSLAGRYPEALAALNEALGYDRRAENSYGLGSDWLARGEVCRKMGDPASALRSFRRAAAIFAECGAEEAAADARGRAESLP